MHHKKILDYSHWSLILELFNHSFQTAIIPKAWKDTRMILLTNKEAIYPPSATRPISLLDSFRKVGEKIFLSCFCDLCQRSQCSQFSFSLHMLLFKKNVICNSILSLHVLLICLCFYSF
jgi:hypothetical protein